MKLEEQRPTTAPRMFIAHIAGSVIGGVLGAIAGALTKKHALPKLGLEESPLDKLASIVKDLPEPEPRRQTRTAPAPHSSDI